VSDLDLDRIVQTVTDAATELSGASFGAFFYNVSDEAGERYTLYSLSGAPRHAFERFGLPRNTEIFAPTLTGTSIVRSNDIRHDPRYGKNAPHFGIPQGHPPVVSYLAVPVVSRTGEVHGGLFFGHHEAGVFTGESEEIVSVIALHAAIALDNARALKITVDEMNRQRVRSEAAQRLAAIVEFSDDAIISKDLNSIIASWNKGAERVFGYKAQEAIGKSITIIIPDDRQDEEPTILAKIRGGERIDHYETIRRRKDGTEIDVSLSISPIKNEAGEIIGASKIARDITERRLAQKQQQLLLREMVHRIKNVFALAGSVVSLSAKSASSVAQLTQLVRDRLAALARAQDLTLPKVMDESAIVPQPAALLTVIETLISPYVSSIDRRVRIKCGDVLLQPSSVTSFALLLHEFTTNAMKYGALSTAEGNIEIECRNEGENLLLSWKESGGPFIAPEVEGRSGFGSLLTETAAKQLGGTIERDWKSDGLQIKVSIPMDRISLNSR
jgi:PAS domain S-box-containing protein